MKKWMIVGAGLLVALAASAAVTPPKPATCFSSGAVIQRDKPVRIWGTGAADAALTVKLFAAPDGKEAELVSSAETKIDAHGDWRVTLPARAAGGPYELAFTVADDGAEATTVLKDVLFGDVWICSGQSNMAWPYAKEMRSGTPEHKAVDFPNLRIFRGQAIAGGMSNVPQKDFVKGGWVAATSYEAVKGFSAVGFHFAADLLKRRPDVPIGLYCNAWNGMSIQPYVAAGEVVKLSDAEKARQAKAGGIDNASVHPLFPLAIRGILWYQGCNHVNGWRHYPPLLEALARSWRAGFAGGEDIAFFICQLAPLGKTHPTARHSNRAAMRWEQMKSGLSIPNAGTVVTQDVGDPDDIHPTDKKTVGERLARLARIKYYGETDLVPTGPYPLKAVREGDAITVTLACAKGLRTSDSGKVKGFTLWRQLPPKKVGPYSWHWDEKAGKQIKLEGVLAEASIDGESVKIKVPADFDPTLVRYAWDDYPDCNLENDDDLPAGPFEIAVGE